MLMPDRLLRVFVEIIFMLLGGLLAWLGASGHLIIQVVERRHNLGWQLAGGLLIVWGAIAWFRGGATLAGMGRSDHLLRSISLGLLGIVMLSISYVPFLWVGRLLIAAGILLIMRGLAGSVIVFRQP
jgi:hypothetical protein